MHMHVGRLAQSTDSAVLDDVIAAPCLIVSYLVFVLLDMGRHRILTLRVMRSVGKK